MRRHSPTGQLKANISNGTKLATGEKGAEVLVEKKEPNHEDVWARLVGRANEDKIFIKGHPVTALLDTGSQVTHISQDFCLAKGIKIHPTNQLMNIEGIGGTRLNMWDTLKLNYPSLWGHIPLKLKAFFCFFPPLNIRKGCL